MRLGMVMKTWRERDGATLKSAWRVLAVRPDDAKRYEGGARVTPQVAAGIRLIGIARLAGVPVFGRTPR